MNEDCVHFRCLLIFFGGDFQCLNEDSFVLKRLKTETSRYDPNSVLMGVMVHVRIYLKNVQQH